MEQKRRYSVVVEEQPKKRGCYGCCFKSNNCKAVRPCSCKAEEREDAEDIIFISEYSGNMDADGSQGTSTMAWISNRIWQETGVNPEVDPKTRVQPRVEARAMLCYIAHKQYGISLPAISKFLKKDRSTMYHCMEQAQNLYDYDKYLRSIMERIMEERMVGVQEGSTTVRRADITEA